MRTKVIFIIFTFLKLQPVVHGSESTRLSENSHQRILFGQVADLSSFPFLVHLSVNGISCGGTIIANQWIMSAAHCIYRKPCHNIIIHPAVWAYGRNISPLGCVVHERYNPAIAAYAYDISLLKVRGDLGADRFTRIIPLPSPGAFFRAGIPAVITGWGQTETGNYPTILLRADVRIQTWETCRSVFAGRLPKRLLCTQGIGPSASGTCFGDSGGPVIVNGVVAGISSFVILNGDACLLRSPSMHVNVADYLPWIYRFISPGTDTNHIKVQAEY